MSYNKKEIEALASLEKTIELTDETSPAYASLIAARDDLKSRLSTVTVTPTPPNPYNSQGENTYRVEEEETAGWAEVDGEGNNSGLTKAEAQEVVQRLYDNGYAPNRIRIVVDGQR
mgnify:FL=1